MHLPRDVPATRIRCCGPIDLSVLGFDEHPVERTWLRSIDTIGLCVSSQDNFTSDRSLLSILLYNSLTLACIVLCAALIAPSILYADPLSTLSDNTNAATIDSP